MMDFNPASPLHTPETDCRGKHGRYGDRPRGRRSHVSMRLRRHVATKAAAGGAHDLRRARHDRRGDGAHHAATGAGARHARRLRLRLLRHAEGQCRDHGHAGDPTRHGAQAIRPGSGAAAHRPAGRDAGGLQGDLDRQSRSAHLPDLQPRRQLRTAQRRRRQSAGQDPGAGVRAARPSTSASASSSRPVC